MNECNTRLTKTAIHMWELGLLKFLYMKGILNEEEYNGIRLIAETENSSG